MISSDKCRLKVSFFPQEVDQEMKTRRQMRMRGNAERTERDSRSLISRFVDHWPHQPSSFLDLRAPRSLPSRFHFKLCSSIGIAGVYA